MCKGLEKTRNKKPQLSKIAMLGCHICLPYSTILVGLPCPRQAISLGVLHVIDMLVGHVALPWRCCASRSAAVKRYWRYSQTILNARVASPGTLPQVCCFLCYQNKTTMSFAGYCETWKQDFQCAVAVCKQH